LPKKRDEKRRWTDPVILAPIIGTIVAAVIAAIVGPIIVDVVQDGSPPSPEQTPTPTPSSPSPIPIPESGITVEMDKDSYVIGEDFLISGNVGKPEFGKSVRIDFYKPDGGPLGGANGLFTKPERDGSYSYLLYSFSVAGDLVPGTYTVRATYLKQSAETNFDAVQ
jgi:hypothetical protein